MNGDRPIRLPRRLLDWMACAIGGLERAADASRTAAGDGLLDRVTAAGTAGHVLDFDDTYLPGVVHLSAPTAPAALVLGAQRGASAGRGPRRLRGRLRVRRGACACRRTRLSMTAAGTRRRSAARSAPRSARRACSSWAPKASARRPHWHCFAPAGFDPHSAPPARAFRWGWRRPRASPPRGSWPPALSSTSTTIARGPAGFEEAFGAGFEQPGGRSAIEENWIKAYPCCLQTHGVIEAALAARDDA